MSGTITIFRVFGIPIKVHFSWIFIFALISWSLATSFLPNRYPGWSDSIYWIVGSISSLMLFVSVLVHELSHSIVALYRRHKVHSITLFFLGGVSEIEGKSHSAGEEFWIAFVGPLTSFILSLLFFLIHLPFGSSNSQLAATFEYLYWLNLIVGLFNLLPAFPLDGGRVLKAIIWKITGSEDKAASASSRSGNIAGFFIIGLGLLLMLTQKSIFFGPFPISGIWLIIVGWFIRSSASSTQQEDNALTGRRVRDAMRTHLPTVEPGMSVDALVDRYISKDFERAYVVSLGDRLLGLVTVSDLKKVPLEARANMYITEVMVKAEDVASLDIDAPLEVALEMLVRTGYHQLLVIENDKPIGFVTRGDVLRVLEISQLISPRTR